LLFFIMGLLPIEWVISVDLPSASTLAARTGGIHPSPRGASHPWRDRMRDEFFFRLKLAYSFNGREREGSLLSSALNGMVKVLYNGLVRKIMEF
jgi:hypothetical protein